MGNKESEEEYSEEDLEPEISEEDLSFQKFKEQETLLKEEVVLDEILVRVRIYFDTKYILPFKLVKSFFENNSDVLMRTNSGNYDKGYVLPIRILDSSDKNIIKSKKKIINYDDNSRSIYQNENGETVIFNIVYEENGKNVIFYNQRYYYSTEEMLNTFWEVWSYLYNDSSIVNILDKLKRKVNEIEYYSDSFKYYKNYNNRLLQENNFKMIEKGINFNAPKEGESEK